MRGVTVKIVVPVHNAPKQTLACLRSVLETRDSDKHALVVIDDGSEPTTHREIRAVVSGHPSVVLKRNETAQGFSAAVNRGISDSKSDVVIVLNSDTIVSPGWIDKLTAALTHAAKIGVVGPLSNAASYQSIPHSRRRFIEKIFRSTRKNRVRQGDTPSINRYLEQTLSTRPIPSPTVHGFCMAIRGETIREVGLFDQRNFPLGHGAESDYCLRASAAGWDLAWATNCFVWHKKSASFSSFARIRSVGKAMKTLRNIYGEARLNDMRLAALQSSKILTSLLAEAKPGIGEVLSKESRFSIGRSLARRQGHNIEGRS